jgi:hypothetical protein
MSAKDRGHTGHAVPPIPQTKRPRHTRKTLVHIYIYMNSLMRGALAQVFGPPTFPATIQGTPCPLCPLSSTTQQGRQPNE